MHGSIVANPFMMAAALSRMTSIQCPHCGFKKAVARVPKHHRVCPRCKKQFPDPLAKSKRR
jgi:DNA-directed RNA polymerase subunit RPC12/RpoP